MGELLSVFGRRERPSLSGNFHQMCILHNAGSFIMLHIQYSAYISRVFNFTNFASLESFVQFFKLKFETLHCNTHEQHEFVKFFSTNSFKAAIRENLDLRNISAIR